MKSKLLLIFIFIYSLSFAQSNNTVFTDYFYSNSKDWAESSDKDRSFYVQDGYYYFDHKRDHRSWLSHQSMDLNTNKDFVIITTIKKVSGIQNYGYGLTFGRKDNDNEYQFVISGNGYYKVTRDENGKSTELKKWTESANVKKNNGSVNTLKIEKSNNKLKFYINYKLVFTTPFTKFFGKRIGFTVSNKQKIAVDYIKVYYLNKEYTNYSNNSVVHYNEDFNNNNNNWLIGSTSDREYKLQNGKYYFEHKRTDLGWTTSKEVIIDTSKDFKLETKIQKITGGQSNGFGLIFGRKNNDNEFDFLLTGNGSYKIYYYKEGKSNILVDWKSSSYINKGNYATNKLSVTKTGSSLKFYINDLLVYSTYFRKFYGNRIGYYISNKQKIAIDNLKVTYLNKTTTINSSENYVFSDNFNSNTKYWSTKSNDLASSYFYDGKFYFNKKDGDGGEYRTMYTSLDTSRDYEIETEIHKISGVTDYGYGLIFGRKNNDNQYYFNITSNGFYRISKTENGTYSNIIKWTTHSALKKENGAKNILKIKKEAGKYKFYINGTFVNSIDHQKEFGVFVGYAMYNVQKIAAEYLTIKHLDQKKKEPILVDPVITNNTNTGNYHLFEDFNNNNNSWSVGDKTEYKTTISGGRYNIEHKRETGGWYFGHYKFVDNSKEFEIETTIERKYSADDGSLAFVFFRKDNDNKHELFISKGGSYLIRKFVNGEKTILKNWTESSAIASGYAPNVIKLKKSASTVRLYINEQYLDKFSVSSLAGHNYGYVVYDKTKITVDNLKIKYTTQGTNYPPEIEIIEPIVVSRGFKIVKSKKINVRGKATDKDGIYEVLINGTDAYIDANGNFKAEVPLKVGDNELIVKVADIKGKSTTKKFFIKRESPEPTVIVDNNNNNIINTSLGNYYALLIGVSNYGDSKIVDLEGLPSKDAEGLANILKSNYNFKPENVKVLVNAKRSDILNAFDDFRKKITEKDNLLIFYAGHGIYEDDSEVGYWLPADAEKDYTANWIQNSVIVSTIKRMKAKHTLLISDACFSGSIFKTRSITSDAPKAYQKLYELPSKKAITSGTLKTVPNKSIFYKYLTDRLQKNTSKYMSALELFSNIKTPVANNSPNIPQYGVIHGIGDEGGDFIFIKN